MPSVDLVVESPIKRSARVMQIEGQFDLAREKSRSFAVKAELPLEDRPWQIGAIIGPSGSGKSTILRQLYGEQEPFEWDDHASILDAFPKSMTAQSLTLVLSSIGFSTPPAWLRPFHTLSNGEQFRANVARALCSDHDPIVIDEFTSVVDRTVARIGAAAVARHLRERDTTRRLVVGSCHDDIAEWLQPDWIYETGFGTFSWRSLQRRPAIRLEVYRTPPETWRIFRHHHYLNTKDIPRSSFCLIALIDGKPAAFLSSLPQVGVKNMQRVSRGVVLPDYQGIGINTRLVVYMASLFKAIGRRWRGISAHPAVIQGRAHSPHFLVDRMPSVKSMHQGRVKVGSGNRLTIGYEYVGPAATLEEARRFGLKPHADYTENGS